MVITSFSTLHTITPAEVSAYAKCYRSGLSEAPDDPSLNSAIAMCYLKLGLWTQAELHFQKAIASNLDNSEIYFYWAISLLEGKRPFTQPLAIIRKAEECANAAILLEPRGSYYLLLAYLTSDYFERKFLNRPMSSTQLLQVARQCGLTPTDMQTFRDVVRQDDLGLPENGSG